MAEGKITLHITDRHGSFQADLLVTKCWNSHLIFSLSLCMHSNVKKQNNNAHIYTITHSFKSLGAKENMTMWIILGLKNVE